MMIFIKITICLISLLCLTAAIPIVPSIGFSIDSDIKTADFLNPSLDKAVIEKAKTIKIKERFITSSKLPAMTIYVRYATPPDEAKTRGSIVLLPGTLGNTKMWAVDTKSAGQPTLKLLAAAGYNAYTADVPGGSIGGRSIGLLPIGVTNVQAMRILMEELEDELGKPVLLSATASGLLAIPYATDNHDQLSGYISAASCCSTIGQNWSGLPLPVLVMRGELDILVPASPLMAAPVHNVVVVPGAGLSFWRTNPDQFHAAVVNFLDKVFEIPSGTAARATVLDGKSEELEEDEKQEETDPLWTQNSNEEAVDEQEEGVEVSSTKPKTVPHSGKQEKPIPKRGRTHQRSNRNKTSVEPKSVTEQEIVPVLPEQEESAETQEITNNKAVPDDDSRVADNSPAVPPQAVFIGQSILLPAAPLINPQLEAAINKKNPSEFQLNILKTTLLSKGKVDLARQVELIQRKRKGLPLILNDPSEEELDDEDSDDLPTEESELAGALIHRAESTKVLADDSRARDQGEGSSTIDKSDFEEVLNILEAVENITLDYEQTEEDEETEEDAVFENDSDLIGLDDPVVNKVGSHGGGNFFNWKTEDFEAPREKEHMPQNLETDLVTVKHETINLPGGSELFYRHASPLNSSPVAHQVLILHDRTLNSKLWEVQNTLKILAAANFDAYAVDLPGKYGHASGLQAWPVTGITTGYGKSEGVCHPLTCVQKIISALDVHNPVLVVPGWSGRFAMPFLFSHPQDIAALLAISPETANRYPKEEYQQLNVPALSLQSDRNKRENSLTEPFVWMPNGQQLILREAIGRPYLLSVDRFHTVLLNFVQTVSQSVSPL